MKKYLIILMLIAVLPLLFHSCQEEIVEEVMPTEDNLELSAIEKRFLESGSLKSGDDKLKTDFVAQILDDIKKQNKAEKFIENLVKKYGYPNWEMARCFEGIGETVAQIPVSKDNGCETDAIILVVKDKKKLKFKLLLRDKFDQFANKKKPLPNIDKIRDLFIIFDFLTYGESAYLPEGKVVFGDENPENTMLKSAGEWVENSYCYTLYVNMGDYSTLRWECESWYVYSPVTDEYADYSPSGGGGTSEWYEEGSGGGGGTSTETNPVLPPELIVLFNEYPCLNNILNTLMSGTVVDLDNLTINSTLTANILNLFDMSGTVNLTIKVDGLGNPDINGRTKQIGGNNYEIVLNKTYVNSATDLSIARTMIHEIIHANLLYRYNLREKPFNELVQIHFNSMLSDPSLTEKERANITHHTYMANNLIPIISDNLYEWCRQSSLAIEKSYCDKLSWGGLDGVPDFETLPNKSEIVQIILNEKLNNYAAEGRKCKD